jgi:hypothetical protein
LDYFKGQLQSISDANDSQMLTLQKGIMTEKNCGYGFPSSKADFQKTAHTFCKRSSDLMPSVFQNVEAESIIALSYTDVTVMLSSLSL